MVPFRREEVAFVKGEETSSRGSDLFRRGLQASGSRGNLECSGQLPGMGWREHSARCRPVAPFPHFLAALGPHTGHHGCLTKAERTVWSFDTGEGAVTNFPSHHCQWGPRGSEHGVMVVWVVGSPHQNHGVQNYRALTCARLEAS